MEKELRKLNYIIENVDIFYCCFIIVSEDSRNEMIEELKTKVSNKARFVDDCNSIEKLHSIKERVMNGEKIILHNLDELYKIFAEGDVLGHDGIYQLYQNFTFAYRDKLWLNSKGQLYFILSEEERNQFYKPNNHGQNHFTTMLSGTFEFTNEKKLIKKQMKINFDKKML